MALEKDLELMDDYLSNRLDGKEKEAFEETRRWLKHRTSTLVVASVFTVLPLTFVFEGSRITFILLRDKPVVAYAWWATAAVMWAAHFVIRRRTRVSGL